MKIALDIDGVLADQVGAILGKIEEKYGYKYAREDVRCAHWCFEGRDIWAEISEHLRDPEYVIGLPVIEGSQTALSQLEHHDMCIVTARRPETEMATKKWLSVHFPNLRDYYHAKVGAKHTIPSDVLIDDFDLNIIEFVKSDPQRYGILFMQPWSINAAGIEDCAERVFFCQGWQSVVAAIDVIDGNQRLMEND